MTQPYRKKEPMFIPDEVGLVIAMLRNPLINHKLKHVIPDNNIIRKPAETFYELPAIVVEKVGMSSMLDSEPLPPDGHLGYKWSSDILLTCVCPEDIIGYYPPAPVGGSPSESSTHNGAENFLRIPAWILYAVLSENRNYQDETTPTFQIDESKPASYNLIAGGYRGVADLWAVEQVFTIDFEMEAEVE